MRVRDLSIRSIRDSFSITRLQVGWGKRDVFPDWSLGWATAENDLFPANVHNLTNRVIAMEGRIHLYE